MIAASISSSVLNRPKNRHTIKAEGLPLVDNFGCRDFLQDPDFYGRCNTCVTSLKFYLHQRRRPTLRICHYTAVVTMHSKVQYARSAMWATIHSARSQWFSASHTIRINKEANLRLGKLSQNFELLIQYHQNEAPVLYSVKTFYLPCLRCIQEEIPRPVAEEW